MTDITNSVGKGGAGINKPELSSNGKHESSSETSKLESELKSGTNRTVARNEASKGKEGVSPKKLTD